jgi:mono/diheme cytochrome c family protein
VIRQHRPLIALAAAAFLAAASAEAPDRRESATESAPPRDNVRDPGRDPGRDTLRTTLDGVYTLAQANTGKDVFAIACQSCHTPTFHATPAFRSKWTGRTLGELFGYMRREMPQADPGGMTDEEYLDVLAYMLRINGMPTGDAPLAGDSASLHRITLRLERPDPTSPDSRR